jgi:D-glycero-D-manno-heptose 1,7-bisphosphate phosphatase
MNRRTIFLDIDGALADNSLAVAPADSHWISPDVAEGLRALHQAGYGLVVATHQARIDQGWFSSEALTYTEIHLRLRLATVDVPLTGFYYCPHHTGEGQDATAPCVCRKPKPGLLMQAAWELKLDLGSSWMIGDLLDDVEAGRWAGCKTVLLTTGKETEWKMTDMRWPDLIADNLAEAAYVIMASDRSHAGGHLHPAELDDQ